LIPDLLITNILQMKKYLVPIVLSSFIIASCGGVNKTRAKSASGQAVIDKTQTPSAEVSDSEMPIIEVKEKLVEVKNAPLDPNVYYVIIGSFKNPNNASNYQEQISTDGFTSVLLQNEAGLYRVSVKSTDDVSAARDEIHRIRAKYSKYSDTWLLIRIR